MLCSLPPRPRALRRDPPGTAVPSRSAGHLGVLSLSSSCLPTLVEGSPFPSAGKCQPRSTLLLLFLKPAQWKYLRLLPTSLFTLIVLLVFKICKSKGHRAMDAMRKRLTCRRKKCWVCDRFHSTHSSHFHQELPSTSPALESGLGLVTNADNRTLANVTQQPLNILCAGVSSSHCTGN